MTNTTNAETPRTDREAFVASTGRFTPEGGVVGVDFSRTLERERNALKSENEKLKEQLEKWKAVADRLANTIGINGARSWGAQADIKSAEEYKQLKKESEL